MKTKLLLTLFLIIPILGFILIKSNSDVKVFSPPPPANENITDSFLIGAMETGWSPDYHLYEDSLGLNMWHKYPQLWGDTNEPVIYPQGWLRNRDGSFCSNDSLFAPWSQYGTEVQQVLHDNYTHHQKTLLQRPKIEWLCYGQRSDYQCETVSNVNQDLWFYTFQLHDVSGTSGEDYRDTSVYGSNQWVRYCHGDPQHPENSRGYVVRRLKANSEQCNRNRTGFAEWWGDSQSDWLIKPRIRIDSMFARTNPETPVCSLKVIAQDGSSILKQAIIKAKYFKDANNNYNGRYIEEYNFGIDTNNLTILHKDWLGTDVTAAWNYNARGNYNPDTMSNHTDIQVYWYANCDMWIDYVRVDNDVANDLFGTSQQHDIFMNWIQWEAKNLACNTDNGEGVLKFYIEVFEFNMIPCMTYVSRKLDSISYANCGKHLSLMADQFTFFQQHMNVYDRGTIMNANFIKKYYLDSVNATQVFGGTYPFLANQKCQSYPTFSRIPDKLPITTGSEILADAVSAANYDAWLQWNLDTVSIFNEHVPFTWDDWWWPKAYVGSYRFLMKLGNEISRTKNIPFIAWVQAHQMSQTCGEMEREPTAEEMDLLANLPVAYGAKGIIYWQYPSWYDNNNPDFYAYCFLNAANTGPRYTNVYGQPKWTKFQEIFKRLKKWGPTVMSFDNTQSFSYIYRNPYERTDLRTNSYIKNIYTFRPGSGEPECPEHGPSEEPPESQSGLTYECPSHTYMQVATFQTETESIDKYFMLVNKRCSPYLGGNSLDSNGGRRDVRLKFYANHSAFNGYNNWTIFDVETGRRVITFDKTQSTLLDLNWYMPGQGKLYRISPVMVKGGTLVTDESISDVSFTCEDTVWNDGYDITIGNSTTISFTDTSKIIMDGGTFQMGEEHDSNPSSITSNAVSSNHWFGYDFNNCTVKVYNSHFQNLANDTTYALNIINCPYVDIRDNTFSFENDALKGGVNVTYYSGSTPFSIQNLYIAYNTFSSNNCTVPLLSVMSYAGITTPALIEHNTLTTSNTSGSTAIMLNEIVGGAVKSNVIANFELSVNALSCSIDIYGNLISSTVNNSVGINGLAGSELKLNPTSGIYLGGMNNVSNTGSSSKNITVNNSYFLLDEGKNVFNTLNNGSDYHLYGSFSNDDISPYETQNCFKFNGTQTLSPAYHVNDYSSDPITFEFTEFNCDNDSSCFAGDLGVGDTVWSECGQGGAFSSVIVVTPKTIHDSLCLEMRKRNYPAAVTKAMALLNLFPDSLLSLDAVSKLYLAKTRTDTSGTSNTELKTFYETLILTHSTNIPLVKRCNYFIQKCKVLLRQYSSAMSGFQQIMEQNPYSYDALVAHWDYMATDLIMQGSGGGESSDYENEGDSLIDGRRSSPITKEQRRQIGETITNIYSETNGQEEKKIEILEELSKKGDIEATKELAEKKALKEAVKTLHPKNIQEHINIVNGDIQKLFAINKSNGSNENQSLIPDKFSLSQNYPNPFNPLTKIKYALPRDVKVVLKIYDILGREVKTLVNEFKKAGYYEIDFTGINLATGVYFYRLEAAEFAQSKKMVLVK
jgi:type IX secretion system substrate protein